MRRSERLTSAVLLAVLLLGSAPARAQTTKPPDDDTASGNSVPRGSGGVVVQPPKQAAGQPAQPTMPRPLNYTPPDYPPEAEKAGLEGTVTLVLDIDKNGKVTKAAVAPDGSAGHGFDESAIAAASKLEFEPARMPDGTPFAAKIQYRYSFTLKKGPDKQPTNQPEPTGASLKGTVVLIDGDVAIDAAIVTITDGAAIHQEAKTNDKGVFDFSSLPPGKYQVSIKAPGYEPLSITEDLTPNEAIEVKYRLSPAGTLEVTIRGERPPREVTKRTLERREISRIPGTNGDALRSIQSMPGVARPPGIAGLLIVRGSGPQDTQTFIDGTPVPLIYHFGGLSSVVPTEMLEKIDFYPGNFSTQYGRVMGGIVDAGLRAPKEDGKYHGLGQIDLIDARAMLEGPIPLLKGWTFAAAGRRSYIDTWLGPVLKAAGAGITQAPVYYDYQFMIHDRPTDDSEFRLAFFGSDDALKFLLEKPAPGEPAISGSGGFHTAFERLQARYTVNIGSSDHFNFLAAIGKDNIDLGVGSLFFLLTFYSLTGRIEYSHKLGKGVIFNVGGDLFSGAYTVTARLPAAPRPGEPPNQPFSTRTVQEVATNGSVFAPAGYVELELAPDSRVKIVPGVRLDYANTHDRVDMSPRVNARYDLFPGYPRTTLKGGVGLFHQPPQFQEVIPPLGTPGLTSNRAIHYSLGFEQELNHHVEASVEGFYKQLDNQVVGQAAPSGATINYTNAGTGQVIGSEVLIKYKPDERFFGWLAYTLSRSTRTDGPGQPERLLNYDQTHILTVLGSYRLGHGWEFGARFRLVSGNLTTPNVCDPEAPDCDPLRTNSLFHAPSGVYTPIPVSGPYSERLPLFHQLDLRVDKRWKFKSWELSTYLDVQNVYNHANAEGILYNFNYTQRSYVSGLPFLPSLGIRGEF